LRVAPALIAALLALCPGPLLAAGKHGDWPCIQREVPQISVGMVWSAGTIDAEDASWTSDAQVAPKVLEVTSRRKTVEEAIAIVDAFAAELKEDRPRLLTALFTGSFQRLNAERRQIMSGIKRFSRRQTALADRIKQASHERVALSQIAAPSDAEKARLAELQEQLAWDVRIYDEREHSLRYVCETPVLLEQRLFSLGRHISQLLSQN
jgi:hypothetical protein